MPTRVLNIHITGIDDAPDHESVKLAVDIKVGLSDASAIADALLPVIDLKDGLGLYKTSIALNLAIVDAVKNHLYTSQSIPTNGYAAVYVSGAYGLLSIL